MTEERELVPVGTYTAPITAYGVYEQNDKDYFEITVHLEDQDKDRSIRIYLTDKALDTGWPQRKLKSLGFNFDLEKPVLTAKEATVTCIHVPGDDKGDFERWDLLLPEFAKEKPSENRIAQLNAMFKTERDTAPTGRDARAEAWAVVDSLEAMSDKEKQDLFAKLAKEYGGGKSQADMTDAEWDEVKDAAEVPF